MRKLAHAEIPRHRPEELAALARHPVVLVLEDIRSAHNVGSILRTADGLLLEEVILCGITPPGDHRSAFKASLGSEAFVPWRKETDTRAIISGLKASGYTIAALELTTHPTVAADLTPEQFPLALVAGNEVEGISDETLALCDLALEIPQYGAKQSLNVSVATAIAAHDIVRRYRLLRHLPLFSGSDQRFTPPA